MTQVGNNSTWAWTCVRYIHAHTSTHAYTYAHANFLDAHTRLVSINSWQVVARLKVSFVFVWFLYRSFLKYKYQLEMCWHWLTQVSLSVRQSASQPVSQMGRAPCHPPSFETHAPRPLPFAIHWFFVCARSEFVFVFHNFVVNFFAIAKMLLFMAIFFFFWLITITWLS